MRSQVTCRLGRPVQACAEKMKTSAQPSGLFLSSCSGESSSEKNAYATLLKQGYQAVAIGDFARGVAAFEQAVNKRPDQAVAFANLGLALRNMGDTARALPALLKAVELYEDDTEPWATNAAVAFFAFAEMQCTADGVLDPNLESALQSHKWMRDRSERIGLAERCTAAAAQSMQVWAMLGMTLAQDEKPTSTELSRAAQAFMKASKLAPRSSRRWVTATRNSRARASSR